MRPKDRDLYNKLNSQLFEFEKNKFSLPGIKNKYTRDTFIKQIIDSIRRVQYVFTICRRDINPDRADPTSEYFDPLKAAILFKRNDMPDEAFWLAFLSIHFGKNIKTGWHLVRDIYGGLGNTDHWTWDRTSSNPKLFKQWLADNYITLTTDGIPRYFGNHRKYETLNPESNSNTGAVIESYVNWIKPAESHTQFIQEYINNFGNDARVLFDELYKSMNIVKRFGRTAKFDYLTMVAKLGLVNIEPGLTYMRNSTGPIRGARLLFGGNINSNISYNSLEENLVQLESKLSLGNIGMQVLEDALCNWQKNPSRYILFHG